LHVQTILSFPPVLSCSSLRECKRKARLDRASSFTDAP